MGRLMAGVKMIDHTVHKNAIDLSIWRVVRMGFGYDQPVYFVVLVMKPTQFVRGVSGVSETSK
jgi:hypothetical protein